MKDPDWIIFSRIRGFHARRALGRKRPRQVSLKLSNLLSVCRCFNCAFHVRLRTNEMLLHNVIHVSEGGLDFWKIRIATDLELVSAEAANKL